VLSAALAANTERIRIGSGGVMLPNHPPLVVAEQFGMLEALYPDRIDLGIGRAPGTDMMTALALRRSQENLGAEDFPQELENLLAFANGTFAPDHPFRAIKAYPTDVPLPPIYLLGSSGFSSQLASQLGLGFAFAHHINGGAAVPAMQMYRREFQPSESFPKPDAILAVSAILADTDAEADDLALSVQYAFFSLQTGRSGPLRSPEEVKSYDLTAVERAQMNAIRGRHFVGSPETVRAQLLPLIEESDADELMVLSMIHNHEARLHSYDLLAEMFEVQPVTVQLT
jgi:luciferase family oxidoreductase group 1